MSYHFLVVCDLVILEQVLAMKHLATILARKSRFRMRQHMLLQGFVVGKQLCANFTNQLVSVPLSHVLLQISASLKDLATLRAHTLVLFIQFLNKMFHTYI